MSKLSDMRAEIAAKAAAVAQAAKAAQEAQAALAEASQGVAEAEAEGLALIQEAVAEVAGDVMPGAYNLTVGDDGTVTVVAAAKPGRKAGTPGTGEPQGEGAVAKEIRRLFYQEGKSVREIAEVMRTSAGAVNRALGAMAQAHARRAAGATG